MQGIDIAIIAAVAIVVILLGVLIFLIWKYVLSKESEFDELLGTWKSGENILTIAKSGNGFTMTDKKIVFPVQIVRNPNGTFDLTVKKSGTERTATVSIKGNTLNIMGTVYNKVSSKASGNAITPKVYKFEFEELLGIWIDGDKRIIMRRSGNEVTVETAGTRLFDVKHRPDGSFFGIPISEKDTTPFDIKVKDNKLITPDGVFTKVSDVNPHTPKVNKFEFEELLGTWKDNSQTLIIKRSGNTVTIAGEDGVPMPMQIKRNPDGTFTTTLVEHNGRIEITNIVVTGNTFTARGQTFTKVQ
jgi:preprotein translocase subunit YajC